VTALSPRRLWSIYKRTATAQGTGAGKRDLQLSQVAICEAYTLAVTCSRRKRTPWTRKASVRQSVEHWRLRGLSTMLCMRIIH
jgi:hypothetical protein